MRDHCHHLLDHEITLFHRFPEQISNLEEFDPDDCSLWDCINLWD